MPARKTNSGKSVNWKAGPKEAEYDQKRGNIVAAAAQIITEKGLPGLKVEAITSQININRSTYFRYFSSKNELIAAVMEAEFDDMAGDIAEMTASIEDPVDMLVEGVFLTIQGHRNNERLVALLGPESKSCIHLQQVAQEIFPSKTVPLIAAILSLPLDKISEEQKTSLHQMSRWFLNNILAMAIFGSGGLSTDEEKRLLYTMLKPAVQEVLKKF